MVVGVDEPGVVDADTDADTDGTQKHFFKSRLLVSVSGGLVSKQEKWPVPVLKQILGGKVDVEEGAQVDGEAEQSANGETDIAMPVS